jgi:phage shock protein A
LTDRPTTDEKTHGYGPLGYSYSDEEETVAGLWDRTMTVIKAKWNKLLNRAENPQETLDYSYEQQLQLLQNVKRGVADVVTAKKRLELQADKLEASVPKLESQAHAALTHGREDLARMALERKTAAQAQLQDLDRQVSELETQQQKALATKIETFRSQKEVMKAQYSAAEASVRIGEASTGIGEQMSDAGAAIQRAREKTEEMQARASAMDELIASGTLEDFTSGDQTQLDRELAQLTSQSKVDDELEKMKAEIGAGPEKKEIEQ